MTTTWLIDLDGCLSTNTWALEHRDALAHGAVVHTACQTAGRGRAGRTWRSPPGVLTASVLLHPDAGVDPGRLALAAGLAVVHACEDLGPDLELGIKWPNDVWLRGRKLAGILCERADDGALVVGIGLNRDPAWGPEDAGLAARSASLAEAGIAVEPLVLLAALRRYLLEGVGLLAAGGWPRLLPSLRQRDILRGRRLHVVDGARVIPGVAAGLGDAGELLIDAAAGRVAVRTGHVDMLEDG